MGQPALEMKNITKRFGPLVANDQISFSLEKGEIHALAGENGAGKSTLMKILFGLYEADSGTTTIDPEIGMDGLGMVQQHFALAGPLSAVDNIILGCEPTRGLFVDRAKALKDLKEIAGEHLQVNWEKPVEELSLGERQRIEILKLLYRKTKVLILDEPTAVLTPHEIEEFFSLLRQLRSQGSTIVIITHKLPEIFALCDRVTVLRAGKSVGTRKVSEITTSDLVQMMVGREIQKMKPLAAQTSQAPILRLDSVETREGLGRLKGVSFSLSSGEILGVAGVEGNGQKALLNVLLGLSPYTGSIMLGGKRLPLNNFEVRSQGVALIPEERQAQGLWMSEDLIHNSVIGLERQSRFSKKGMLNLQAMRSWAQECVSKYQIRASGVDVLASGLSGGNQQKLIVAREIEGREAKLILASQPTRGVDIGAIEFIHQRLLQTAQEGCGVLLISSDLDELMSLSSRIVVLYEGKMVGEFRAEQGYNAQALGHLMTGGNKL